MYIISIWPLQTAEHQIIGKRLDAEKLDKSTEQGLQIQSEIQQVRPRGILRIGNLRPPSAACGWNNYYFLACVLSYAFFFLQLYKKLPEERQLAEQKLSSLRKLKMQLDTTASWILEIRAQLATAKHRSDNEKTIITHSVLVSPKKLFPSEPSDNGEGEF